jgi:phosphatidylserine/phosphatidylglycerophosphate/cardiolipin synthase-like enzyme
VTNPDVAGAYLKYWIAISKDPVRLTARKASTQISKHPLELVKENSIGVLFSPRHTSMMLDWYANRMEDAGEAVLFTAAFAINKKLVPALAADKDFLRFVLMEKRPSKEEDKVLRADRDLVVSYGAVLGEFTTFKDGKKVKTRIKDFELDKWFEEEEHFRKAGNIFFVHTKFLLVDPLSDDPLVCTGSANFSDNSLLYNDENMLLIRGDTRVADIYLTEFDRIFRHFYFRDVANEIELRGGKAEGAFLDESDSGPRHWTASYFKPGAFKTRRREMFFAPPGASGWANRAGLRPKNETAKTGDTPK